MVPCLFSKNRMLKRLDGVLLRVPVSKHRHHFDTTRLHDLKGVVSW
jgi:hypothetical protein